MKARWLLLTAFLCAPILHAQDTWVAEAQVLMVSLPQDAAVSLVPELQDEKKSAAAMRDLFQQLADGRAELLAAMQLKATGNRATTETAEDMRCPINYWICETSKGVINFSPETKNGGAQFFPTAIEGRNTGPSVELETKVSPDGKSVECKMAVQRVVFAGYDLYKNLPTRAGVQGDMPQPRFHTLKSQNTLLAHSGQWLLLGIFPQVAALGRVELHLFKVTTHRVPAFFKITPPNL